MSEQDLRAENERLKRELNNALMTIGKIAMGDPGAQAAIDQMRRVARETGFDKLAGQ